jgi:LPXTG-site transpeptidase (sortase) family protein
MSRRRRAYEATGRCGALALALCIIFAWPMLFPPSGLAQTDPHYYVEQTGQIFSEPFLTPWINLNGKTTLGLPVTAPISDGARTSQYFQLGVLATDGQQTAAQIERGKAGSMLLSAQHDPTHLVAGRRVGGDPHADAFVSRADPQRDNVVFDSQTGHTIAGRILGFYREQGGKDRFGAPLSESYVSGGTRVQWFEYGRLQWRLTDQQVTAGPVGLELARLLGLDTSPHRQGSLPIFEPDRFRKYVGDGTIPQAPGPFNPIEIKMPAINVDAQIEEVGIDNGVMGVPKDAWNVGWYPDISTPGDNTNVVMAGHKDWWGIGPTVFYNLGNMQPGDKIYLIDKDGSGFTYQVTKTWLVAGNTPANEIVSDTGHETLTLITCGGSFDGAEYDSRVIVRADRI